MDLKRRGFLAAGVSAVAIADPPPLKWSTPRYVFGRGGGPECREGVLPSDPVLMFPDERCVFGAGRSAHVTRLRNSHPAAARLAAPISAIGQYCAASEDRLGAFQEHAAHDDQEIAHRVDAA